MRNRQPFTCSMYHMLLEIEIIRGDDTELFRNIIEFNPIPQSITCHKI